MVQNLESDEGLDWFDARSLSMRKPDYIALDSLYYERWLRAPNKEFYPQVAEYFRSLLAGELGYRVIFDRKEIGTPRWLYPDEIGFLDNRIVILERECNRSIDLKRERGLYTAAHQELKK